MTTVQFSY